MPERLDDLLFSVSQSPVVDSGNLSDAGKALLQSLASGLRVSRVSIWLYDESATALQAKLAIHHGTPLCELPLQLHRNDFPRYFNALQQERAITANTAVTDPATSELAEAYLIPEGVTSMLDAPIRHHGAMVGIICAEHNGPPRIWSQHEIHFATAHADLYGRALSAYERNQYESQLIAHNSVLEEQVRARTADLLEAEKMAALGKLVAGVAHEVNTPLGVAVTAIGHCEEMRLTLQRSFDTQSLTQSQLSKFLSDMGVSFELLSNNLARASALIQNFKRTAVDQSHFELCEFELASYLKTVVASLRPLLKVAQPKVVVDCEPGWLITSYPGALAQILTNLITNTCEHGFSSRQSHSGWRHSPDPLINIHCEHDDKFVYCTYKDNGCGMSEDNLKQACEPFFTTNRQGGGSGLGLAIVYNLVRQQLGGTLRLSAPAGEGLTVSIQMPLQLRAATAPQS